MLPPSQSNPEPSRDQDVLRPYAPALRTHFPAAAQIIAQSRARQRRQRIAAASTCCVALVSLWLLDPVYRTEDFATAVGQRKTQTLADGSEITLNTGSRLTIEWHLVSRRLVLVHGEAVFRVVHNWRPFVVATGSTSIRDIGTVFNVRNDKTATFVTVFEGAVEVSNGDARTLLATNQAVAIHQGRLGAPHIVQTAQATAWQHGKLHFDGTPLESAIADIQRYHTERIVLRDERSKRLRLSGEFETGNIDALLDLLPQVLPVKIVRQADGTVELSAI